MSKPKTILEKLEDLHKQATTEHSHFYTALCLREAITEIKRLQASDPVATAPTQRQRYKEAIAGMAEREGIRLGLIDETLFANDCGRMADALCKEDAEHAKKEKL